MRNDRAISGAANDDQPPHPLPPPERLQVLLFDAARLGRVDVIPALLRFGANIDATDVNGYTPLILASYRGQEAATSLLLAQGADVDRPDAVRGNTALMGVAFKGYAKIAATLLAAGADPNVTNCVGQTAIMLAALFGRCTIVDQLLQVGADPIMIDRAGNSAISVAQTQGNDLMVARLTARRVAKI